MLNEHSAALKAVSEAYHNFLLRFKKNEKVVYGFVEGKQDPSFYRGTIDALLPPQWKVRLVQPGNRKKVIETFREFDWNRFDSRRVCFFIDSDLVRFICKNDEDSTNIYKTDGYSIENSIATEETFMRVIDEMMGLSTLTVDEEEEVSKNFVSARSQFVKGMEIVMALILCWRREGTNAKLENINLSKIWDITGERVRRQRGVEDDNSIMAAVACDAMATQYRRDDIDIALDALDSSGGAERNIRGKYLAWFFVHYASAVHAESAKFKAYSEPPKASVTLGAGTFMSMVAPRARTPLTLREFINNNYCRYISDVEAA